MVCVFECVLAKNEKKKMKKVAVCAHISVFRVSIITKKEEGKIGIWKVARIALSSFATFFFTFHSIGRERERERDIDICRENNT